MLRFIGFYHQHPHVLVGPLPWCLTITRRAKAEAIVDGEAPLPSDIYYIYNYYYYHQLHHFHQRDDDDDYCYDCCYNWLPLLQLPLPPLRLPELLPVVLLRVLPPAARCMTPASAEVGCTGL